MERMRRRLTWADVIVTLAVVAIFGIVLIPNCIDAVSLSNDAIQRAHLQALGTALEAYKVDNANYPPWIMNYPNDFQSGPNAGLPFHFLTTPVNYVASPDILVDVYLNGRGYAWWRLQGTPGDSCFALNDSCYLDDFQAETSEFLNCPAFKGLVTPLQSYGLQGAGPTREIIGSGICRGTTPLVPYDPTNGITSRGFFFNFGPPSLSVRGWMGYQ